MDTSTYGYANKVSNGLSEIMKCYENVYLLLVLIPLKCFNHFQTLVKDSLFSVVENLESLLYFFLN